MKNKYKLFVFLMVLLLVFMLLQRSSLPGSWKELFSTDSYSYRDPEKLLKDIRTLHSMVVVTAQETVVWDSVRQTNTYSDQLILSGKGNITAGNDLRLLMPEDLVLEGDSIALKLPPAELLTVQDIPSSIIILKKSGEWTTEAMDQVKKQHHFWLQRKALSRNMPGMAEQRAREWLDNYLRMIGFEKVTLY